MQKPSETRWPVESERVAKRWYHFRGLVSSGPHAWDVVDAARFRCWRAADFPQATGPCGKVGLCFAKAFVR
jgi:hypothetical protein